MKLISNNQIALWVSGALAVMVVSGLSLLPSVVSAHGGTMTAEEEKTEVVTMVIGAVAVLSLIGFVAFKFLRKDK